MVDQPTICGFCSCGCALYIEPRYGGVGALCPSATHPVSAGRLCIKGWNATPALIRADRLNTPLVRKSDELRPASWDEAFKFTASAIKKAISEGGPGSVGVIGSAKTTNEECYSLVKFARSIIGTSNVDGACRFYDAALIDALLDTTGTPASQTDLKSLVNAGSMLIVGANVMEQLAHIGSRIQDAADNGCRIVAADPRTSRLAPQTEIFLHPWPGTDLAWLRALLKTIIDRKLYVESAAELPGFEELRSSLDGVEMSRLAEQCGVDDDAVARSAELLVDSGPPVVMFGLGALQQAESTRVVKALADVALLLGGLVIPLRGQNNAQGACDMGLAHNYLPGYAQLSDSEARKKWEDIWGCRITPEPGLNAVDMMRACGTGDLKALLVFGENVALSAPNTDASVEALGKVGFLAVADLYLTETARLADVVFPACSFLEKDGTFTNIERRVQRVRKLFDPVGESKPDLEIVAGLAKALGRELAAEPGQVMAEIAENVPQYSGVSYAALDTTWGEQWPTNGAKPRLAAVPAGEAGVDSEYPFRLIASRINFHTQTGTMAARSAVLAREYPDAVIELNEGDAEKLGLRPGRRVTVSSRSGSLTRGLALSDSVPAGCVHVPHFFGGDSPNMLSSYECDATSGVPAYKACAVKVEAAG